MKVLGIVGSPHKDGMTASLVKSALEGAIHEGAEIELIYLIDEDLKYCEGCGGGCFRTYRCVKDESATLRSQRVDSCDALVFGVPVYCWQINGLSSLFIDKQRFSTGSIIGPSSNARPALGITVAGGSGTGCILALQTLYKYFFNWSFRGIDPLPVTRFNYNKALELAKVYGGHLVQVAREKKPFSSFGEAIAYFETLEYMNYTPIDELHFIVKSIIENLGGEVTDDLKDEISSAEKALIAGNRTKGAIHLDKAYRIGVKLWNMSKDKS
ncbi:flavodoxin family protein [bacterium]|nr:flavodoxin family protein [bacterium]